MDTLTLPIVSLFLTSFLMIVFFSKKRAKNEETKIYSNLLIINLLDTILAIITYIFAKTVGNDYGIQMFQKIYMSLMILMTVYINCYNISIMKINETVKICFTKIYRYSFIVVFILIISTPLNVINYKITNYS